jgi:hypothetical protein
MRGHVVGIALATTIVLASCGGEVVETPPATTPSSPVTSMSRPPSPLTPPPSPDLLPDGLPAAFSEDLDPADLPPGELVPGRAEVTGLWFARTSAGDAVVVAWSDSEGDPFQRAGGIAAWRRFHREPPWRAVFGRVAPAEQAVLGVRATTADVTGDASEDALIVQDTGGSGNCGHYVVVDLVAAASVWEFDLCDGGVDVSRSPVGLVVNRAVFKEGDAHCCPSAFRRTVLTYDGGGSWTKVSEEETPA